MHPAILDRQLRSGDAVIRSGQSLFENAAGRHQQTGRRGESGLRWPFGRPKMAKLP